MDRILIVEDEDDMAEIIAYTLKNGGFKCDVAQDISTMWDKLSSSHFNLVLLDIGLPDGSGMDALKTMKTKKIDIPVIILTARRSDIDKILGLELGADDYITKPFNQYELLARIKAVLRRSTSEKTSDRTFEYNGKLINLDSYSATNENGEKIEFTNKEFELLKLLIAYPAKVFTREEILDRVWGMDFFGEFRTVDVHVSKIREKLGESIIKTVRGVGYKLGDIGETNDENN
ncbi:MAG: response regulator transcription factor [Thermotogae bacterium]|jgi:DNA-binding response OmpR family regulator|nr:response regulator transcription factor [Thermotogota bacterium]MCL5033067.1 response regulator transcription factor [Thermotogota bacterium]